MKFYLFILTFIVCIWIIYLGSFTIGSLSVFFVFGFFHLYLALDSFPEESETVKKVKRVVSGK